VRRWLLPAALLVAVPKCLLCVLAYAGLGTALGLGGPELCGGATGATGAGWAVALLAATLAGWLVPGLVRRFLGARP